MTGRERAEQDVQADPARADAREGGEYVGRIAADDDFTGEDGADRRARAQADAQEGAAPQA